MTMRENVQMSVVNMSGMMIMSKMKVQLKMDITDGKAPENVF